MIIIGVYKVNIQYKSGLSKKTDTKYYYAVCDGQNNEDSGDKRVQYIDEYYLDSITYIM